MFKATKEIYDAVTGMGLKANIVEVDGCSMVCVQYPLEYSAPIDIRFMSTDDDNDVAVRVDLMRVQEKDVDIVLPLINAFNVKKRYVKFTLGKLNDINVEYDMPLSGDQVGECAKEMIGLFMLAIHKVHPQLLHALVREESEDTAC